MKKTILLPFLLVAKLVFSCGYSEPGANYNFYDQECIQNHELERFLFSVYGNYFDYDQDSPFLDNQNQKTTEDYFLEEWMAYFGKTAKKEDIKTVLYQWNEEELKNTAAALKQNATQNFDNTVQKIWATNKKQAAIDYLIFAKKCAKLVDIDHTWAWTSRQLNPSIVNDEIAEGLELYHNCKDDFLKLRYGFQLVRLSYYVRDFESTLMFFEDCVAPAKQKSYIYYRALERKAGAQRGLDNPEFAYTYSRVFHNLPDRRSVSGSSFRFNTDGDWKDALKFCKNKEEKAVFYVMRCLWGAAYVPEELENIVRLAPKSPYLKLLFAREIAKYENFQLPGNDKIRWWNERGGFDESKTKNLGRKMLQLSSKADKDFWRVAVAYLEMADKNYTTATELLALVPKKSAHYKQARLLDFVFRLVGISYLEEREENAFFAEYEKHDYLNKNEYVKPFMREMFGAAYQRQGEVGKAFLCYSRLSDLEDNLNLDVILALESFLKKKNYSPFEKQLIEEVKKTESKTLAKLAEMRGIYYLQRNQLKEAIKAFQKLPKTEKGIKPHIFSHASKFHYYNDNFENHADRWSKDKRFKFLDQDYSLFSYTKMLQTLERKAIDEPNMAAWYYYLLGNTWNNMGIYGYHGSSFYYAGNGVRNRKMNCAGTDLTKDGCKYRYGEPYSTFFYFDTNIARSYLQKALAATKDKELQVRITFALARTEQIDYWQLEYGEKKDATFNSNFKTIEKKYMDTEYYKEVIEECHFFQVYLKEKETANS